MTLDEIRAELRRTLDTHPGLLESTTAVRLCEHLTKEDAMAAAKKTAHEADSNRPTEMLGVRMSKRELDRVHAMVEQLSLGTASSLGRRAMMIGLDLIEKDPMVLLSGGKR